MAGLEREYVLEPVAVGTPLTEAPLQMTELLNVGDAGVSYRVKTLAIKRVQDSQGHGVPVRVVSCTPIPAPRVIPATNPSRAVGTPLGALYYTTGGSCTPQQIRLAQ